MKTRHSPIVFIAVFALTLSLLALGCEKEKPADSGSESEEANTTNAAGADHSDMGAESGAHEKGEMHSEGMQGGGMHGEGMKGGMHGDMHMMENMHGGGMHGDEMKHGSAKMDAKAQMKHQGEAGIGDTTLCPVMGNEVTVTEDTPFVEHNGNKVYFCCAGCDDKFVNNADPDALLQETNKKVDEANAQQ